MNNSKQDFQKSDKIIHEGKRRKLALYNKIKHNKAEQSHKKDCIQKKRRKICQNKYDNHRVV